MKILVLASYTRSLMVFRGDLLREMIKKGHEVYASAPEQDEGGALREMGVSFMQIGMQRAAVNPFADMKLMAIYKELIKDIRPDVLFCYTIKPNIYGGMVGRRAGAKKVYLMIEGLGNTFTNVVTAKQKLIQAVVKVLYKRSVNRSDSVIFLNPDDKNELMRMGIVRQENTHLVNGAGVNMEYFTPSPLPDKPVFLMVSRLLREKGVMEYLQAARLVRQAHPQSRILLLGPYEPHGNAIKPDELTQYIADGDVEYLGETKDVRPYYEASSVVVLPSYREGTPRTMLEAMACGRAVITTDAPGCRETVIPKKTGHMVPVRDVEALANAMIWMIEHSEDARQMGEAGLQFCKEKYEVSKVNASMMEILGV